MVEDTSALVILPFFIQVTRVTLTALVSHRYSKTQNYINYVHWLEKQFRFCDSTFSCHGFTQEFGQSWSSLHVGGIIATQSCPAWLWSQEGFTLFGSPVLQ